MVKSCATGKDSKVWLHVTAVTFDKTNSKTMKPTQKKPKFQRSTEEQLNFFVDFCRQQPEMLAGRPNPLRWRELAEKLNAMKGPTRTAAKWKENLAVWKSQLRGRARRKRADHKITGGAGPCNSTSQELKERALSTFGNAAVKRTISTPGVEESPESLLPATVSLGPASPTAVSLGPASPAAVSLGPASPAAINRGPAASPTVLRPTSTMTQTEAIDVILRSIERRDEREEQHIQAQLATAAALQELSRGLLTLAKVIESLNNK